MQLNKCKLLSFFSLRFFNFLVFNSVLSYEFVRFVIIF
nr:MAG TPA: hypothetical protein [Caudoviricetes sp.]